MAAATSESKTAAGKSATAKGTSKTLKPAKAAAPKAATTKPALKVKGSKPASEPTRKPAKMASASGSKPAKPAKSRDTSKSAKEHDEHIDRIWELARRIGVAMFVTWDGEAQRARPLAATLEKEENAIYFLTDVHGQKDDQITEFPNVSVNFADHKHSKYVAISGRAEVLNDREKIKDLWSPFAKAWWDSPEDPAIRVIRLTPADAELWDSPGRIVTTISMLAAAVTGRSPKIGENAKVVL